MINTLEFFHYLKQRELDFFVGVPDSLLKHLCACIQEHSDAQKNILAANEGNAIAIAAGYHIASQKFGVVYMQNSGIGNSINPLVSLADEEVYRIPMLILVGWRGEAGTKDEPQHRKQGRVTLELFQTIGIETRILSAHYKEQIDECFQYMKENSKPIAILIRQNTFSEYKMCQKPSRYSLTREQALQIIVGQLSEEDFIVSTTGKTSRELFEIREKNKQGHRNDFLTVGSMGHTASIAFGISLGVDKDIYCIDGDGSFIMHTGGFGIITQNAKKNFKYILINNGAHESVGGQPTVGFQINVAEILKGEGFLQVYEAYQESEIICAMQHLKKEKLAALIIYTKQGAREALGRPTIEPVENKRSIMNKLQQKSRKS